MSAADLAVRASVSPFTVPESEERLVRYSDLAAEREVKLWFGEEELCDWEAVVV